jgi:hypothetical protein
MRTLRVARVRFGACVPRHHIPHDSTDNPEHHLP